MHKKTKFFITFCFFFAFCFFSQNIFAKYVIEEVQIVAKLDIDRTPPIIELMDLTSSNKNYPTYANQTHLISGHIKVIEKNIVKNTLSPDTIKIAVGNRYFISEKDIIPVQFKSFSLTHENGSEKIYEFSFTNTTGDGALGIIIPSGIIEDKSRISK